MHPALVAYDWSINLGDEIRSFWKLGKGHKPTAAALLYFLSRYSAIVLAVLPLQTMFPMSETVNTQTAAYFFTMLMDFQGYVDRCVLRTRMPVSPRRLT